MFKKFMEIKFVVYLWPLVALGIFVGLIVMYDQGYLGGL